MNIDRIPGFSLGARLLLCAEMVRPGALLADIGTDHAYLPIWLFLHGKISHAVAVDVRPGPLQAAEQNIRRWKAETGVCTRLSDGLAAVHPEEAGDVVIAGMGGELIARIIQDAPWLKQAGKRLILQPMTSQAELRRVLAEEGYAILQERAVEEFPRVYSVLCAEYAPDKVRKFPGWEEIGGLDGSTEAGRRYLLRRAGSLEKQAAGLRYAEKQQEAAAVETVIAALKEAAAVSGGNKNA